MRLYQPELLEKEELSSGVYSFWLSCPELAQKVGPGQFIGVRVRAGFHPFLRRPFSIAQILEDRLQIVFKLRGDGTRWLSRARPGEPLDILGPLGTRIGPYRGERMLLVGGGVGIAPLLLLAQESAHLNRVWVLAGARTSSSLVLIPELFELAERFEFSTEDGSRGHKGLVTQLIAPAVDRFQASCLFACGPEPMLKAIQGMGLKIPCYAFLESRLGCGCGLCFGCAVKSLKGGYYRVCQEGPVFDLHEVVL